MMYRALLSGVLIAAVTACSGASTTPLAAMPADGTTPNATYTTKYVQLVIFENESYNEIIGSSQAPYINGLAKQWANMTNSHAITHPSEPNYLALFSGSTQVLPGTSVR